MKTLCNNQEDWTKWVLARCSEDQTIVDDPPLTFPVMIVWWKETKCLGGKDLFLIKSVNVYLSDFNTI